MIGIGLRTAFPAGLALVLLAVSATTATAAETTVSATPNLTFSPARIGISPGDTVVWRNGGGDHNVVFDDDSFAQPSAPSSDLWTTIPKPFPAAGRFGYHCARHGGPNGSGMSGTVVVGAPGQPAPDTAPPRIRSLALAPRPGRLALSFKPSEAGRARIVLSRRVDGRFATVRTVVRKVGARKIEVTLRRARGRSLRPGRYRVTVTVRDAAGNAGRTVRATATVD